MQQTEAKAILSNYVAEIEGILSRFVRSAQSVTIGMGDSARYNQIIVELKDLFDDLFVDGSRYSRSISVAHAEGISNFLGIPSYHSIETVKGVLAGSATRVARNPKCLKSETSHQTRRKVLKWTLPDSAMKRSPSKEPMGLATRT